MDARGPVGWQAVFRSPKVIDFCLGTYFGCQFRLFILRAQASSILERASFADFVINSSNEMNFRCVPKPRLQG
jgi:hypothetical protein